MTGWIKDLISGLIGAVLDALTSATQAALNWVLGLLSATVFSSPNVTALPQVTYVAGHAQLAANACMALIVMVAGILVMTHGGVQERYSLKDLLPRMVIGFVAANMALPIVSVVIAGANALTNVLAGDSFTSQDSFDQIRRVVFDTTTDPAMFIVALVLRELALWMLIGLVITWLGRLSVLLVVAGTGPVALMCHALPQTEPLAHIWWRSLVGCLAVQVLQAVTLHMAVATLLSSDANLPALGLPHDPTGLLNMLIACFLLWLVIRIPKWVARNFGGTAGRGVSLLGSVVRVVLVQQALRAVGLRGGTLLGRGKPAARGLRPPATHLHSHQHTGSHLHQHLHVHSPRPGRPPNGSTPGGATSGSPTPGGSRGARPHGGRGPVGALPAGTSGSAGLVSPPPGSRVTPPGAVPLRRPRWQAYGAQPSGTGWPTPPVRPRPAAGRPPGTVWPASSPGQAAQGRSTGTGWPGGPAESKTRRSGVRRGQ
jgi:hypothetical protein